MYYNIKTISPKELNKNSFILDVRSEEEIEEMHLALPFINKPSTSFDAFDFIEEYNLDGSQTVNILCRSGARAFLVAENFIEEGYDNIAVIEGGILQAEEDGLEIIKKQ